MNKLINNIKDNFTRVPNEIITDDRLSWKAKGIFLYLMSKPADWDFYMSEIKRWATDGKNSLQSGLKELEEHGYLIRKKRIDESGKFNGWLWIVTIADGQENRQTENPTVGKTDRRKTVLYNKTNSTKTELSNTDVYICAFSKFWDKYDKKVDKKKAQQSFNRLSQKDIEQLMKFIPIYKKSVRHKQYLKNPATFLNSRIWEDDWNEYKSHEPTNTNTGRTQYALDRYHEIFGEDFPEE